ncbi:MAG: GLPGLI family protein [Flavobacterium sp.]|nr:MAG: GLPGLI family protein [Flavobacterium sp.]
MKKIIILLFLTINSYAQIQSGKIEYKLVIGYDEKLSNDVILKPYLEKAQEGAKQISFFLSFNKEASFFEMNDFVKDENTEFAKAFSVATNSYYTLANSEKKIKQVDNHFGQFIVNYHEKTEWELENETKYIGEHLCYKASSEQIVINSKGTFKHPITAWYCPNIPFSFGPKGYTALPGLILELQERNLIYGAFKIDLKKENDIIAEPKKGKVLTEEEYNKIISKPSTF